MVIEELVKRIVRVYSKYIDEDLDLYMGNRYLMVAIENLIHETRAGLWKSEDLQRIAMMLRDALVEGPGSVNPYVMEVLGILEEKADDENIREALELSRKLFREDRFEKIEV